MLSAHGEIALTGSKDGTACIRDIFTGELLKTLKVGSDVTSVALSADGALALTGTISGKVLVWNAKSGALLNTLLPPVNVRSLALSKDGKKALVSTTDGKIWVRNLKSLLGQNETSTPLTVLEGHRDRVCSLAFGGGDFITSGSYDKTALIWKPFALELRGPQEHEEVLRQAYKETFSRPKFLFPDKK